MPVSERNINGTFKKLLSPWTPDDWDNGFYDKKGKFRVYRPDYPRSIGSGFYFRAHIVWWLNTGQVVPKTHVLHHKNQIKDDDRFENLELMEWGNHTRLHRIKDKLSFKCTVCNITFCRLPWRVKGRIPKFCSHKCRNERGAK